MSKSMKALVLAGILSIAAASAVQAGGHSTSGDFRGGANAATNGQSQGQKSGHHPSGTQHRGGHNSAAPKRTKTVAPMRVYPICSPFCTGVDHPW